MSAPRVTAENPADGQVETLEGTMLAECFQSVLGASRGESACRRLERGNAHLIESDQENERKNGDLPDGLINSVPAFHCCCPLSFRARSLRPVTGSHLPCLSFR